MMIISGLQYSYGQYFSVGNDPSGIRWKRIERPGFSLIYPDYYESRAKELCRSGSQILSSVGSSLYLKPGHFRAVVHPESIQSNGWTMWVPRKVELAPMPSLYNMAEKYADHLLIHEFRHIVQLDKSDQGLTRVLGWFLGDQAAASVQAIQIPDWVSEGDAVLTESLLSHSGRGRNPMFSEGMRALMLDNRDYKYDKVRLGSYRDYVPDHYVLGYHMVSMARLLDQDRFWSNVMDNVARKPFRISNFNRYLRKRTGLWQGGLFLKTKEYLCEFCRENSTITGIGQIDLILNDSSDYFNYIKPYPESDTSWICLKRSYGDLPAIVRLFRNRVEEFIIYPGSINGASFSYSGGTLAWAQQIADPRWEMRSFSDVFLYDIDKGKKIRITKNQRYLYPVLNADNTSIACIEELINGLSQLVVMNKKGSVLYSTGAIGDGTFRQPVWSANGGQLYALLTGRDGKKLVEWDIAEESIHILYDFGFKEVNQLDLIGNQLVFTAPIGTIQGLYAFDLGKRTIIKLIANENGVGYPAVSDDKLCVSVLTPDGYRPAQIYQDDKQWTPVDEIEDLKEPILSNIERAEKEYPINYLPVDTADISSTKYSKIGHLFNFHSWAPVYFDTDSYSIRPGALIMSQNDLNTLISSFGIQQNKQTRGIDYSADLTYTGFYPEIGLNILAGKREADTLFLDQDTLRNVQYFDLESRLSLSVPLFFSKGSYYQRIQPYFFLTHHKLADVRSMDSKPGEVNPIDLSYATATLGFAGQVLRRMSYRDLQPRWGFSSGFQAEAGIANPEVQAFRRISAYVRLYTPGIMKNHSLRTYIGFSGQDKFSMPRLPFVSLPRGIYEPVNYNYSSFKLDYSFPIAYPDWSIPSILYVTRFKANTFIDGAHTSSLDEQWSLKTGIDLSSNFYLLRIGVELDAGVRIIYDPLEKKWHFELLYSFDIQ